MESVLHWPATPEHEACPGAWVMCSGPLYWRQLIFSFPSRHRFHWDIQVNREFLKGDAPMSEKHLKAVQLYSELKLPQDFIFFQSEWPSSIKQTIKCWQGYRRRSRWFIPGGNANLYNHCGNQCGGSSESWNWCTARWSCITLEYIPKKLLLPRPLLIHVHCSSIFNS